MKLTRLAVAASLTVAQHQRLKGAAWQRQRNAALNRACGLCECVDCKALGRTRPAHEVDHIVPVWAGGSDDIANLQAINRDCHAIKTAREASLRARNDAEATRQDVLNAVGVVGV